MRFFSAIKSAPIVLGALFLSCTPHSDNCSEGDLIACQCMRGEGGVEAVDESCLVAAGFVGRLKLLDEEDNPSYCTAFLIGPRNALTAAHCLSEFTFSASFETAGRTIPVADIKIHSGYQYRASGGSVFDLAAVSLSEDAGIVVASFADLVPTLSERLYVIGYGAPLSGTTSGGALHSGVLEVKAVEQGKILAAAPDGGKFATCVGDSGGPALVMRDGKLTVVGLVSAGTRRNCGPGDQTFLTLVTTGLVADDSALSGG